VRDSYDQPSVESRGLVRRGLEAVASKVLTRTIRKSTGDYLSRHYLFGAPTMPDGSYPFDEDGNPRKGIVWPRWPFAIYLHHFHQSDSDGGELHSHPQAWSVSLILLGGYSEERLMGGEVVRRNFEPGDVNILLASDFHRVDLLEKDAWTLFVAGPRVGSWSFWNRHTNKFTPWREFVKRSAARCASAQYQFSNPKGAF
jgi:hypothetical protein